MVLDELRNSARYEALHPRLAEAFAFLRRFEQNPLPEGRVELEGAELYALVQSYDTSPAEQKKWESHRRYIDVQYVTHGQESMFYAPLGTLAEKGGYLPEKDAIYYEDGPSTMLCCPAGTFAVFFPEDLHKPCCALGEPCAVRKVVVKILGSAE